MSDMPPEEFYFPDEMDMPPPPDYDMLEPPPFFDDPYPDDWFGYAPEDEPFMPAPSNLDAFIPDDYTPDDSPIPDLPSPEQDGLQGFEAPEPDDEAWSWSDARLIGIDRGEEAGTGRYEIGGMDVYANHETGDLGASYLPIAAFATEAEAEEVFHDLQEQIHDEGIAVHEMMQFAEEQAFAYNPEPENWRGAEPLGYEVYEEARGLDELDNWLDVPPDDAIDPLIEAAIELGGVVREIEVNEPEFSEEQQALAEIGIQVDSFNPVNNPPPFYDEQTGTAYWIGVFQPDVDDRENCVTSILSLGRDTENDELVAHLAPCVPGDWDKTYGAAEYLIDVAQRGGIEPCFDAAEGMALATEQREFWQDARGVPLENDAVQNIAEISRENWELNL